MTPLMEAASNGDLEQVNSWLREPRSMIKIRLGRLHLYVMVWVRDFRTISLESEEKRKTEIDSSDKTQSAIVKFLIEKGSKTRGKGYQGRNCYILGCTDRSNKSF